MEEKTLEYLKTLLKTPISERTEEMKKEIDEIQNFLPFIMVVDTDLERLQLVRSFAQRLEFLESVDPSTWDASDRGGLKECKAAVHKLLNHSKKMKVE